MAPSAFFILRRFSNVLEPAAYMVAHSFVNCSGELSIENASQDAQTIPSKGWSTSAMTMDYWYKKLSDRETSART